MTMWVFVIAALSSAFLASSRPCSPDLQVSWVVDNSARASELARAANCSGGAFDVEWIGHVELPETIYIVDGTVMNITGAGSGDVANGANSTQFLNVVNAALRVSGLRIQNCSTLDSGGAIYAEASTMHFNETTWSHNTAGYDGGAIAVYNSSDVSWSGETSFSRNSAGVDGGALYAHKSDVTWTGGTIFSGNFAGLDGGGMKVNGSDVSWFGATIFSNNTADDDGGALYAYLSTVSWNGETSFARNNASGDDGGALALYYSNVSWNGETSFSGNNAVSGESMGGALFAWESDVSWSAETSFSRNSAGYSGGALAVWYSNIFWSRETSFSGNIAYFFNPRTGDSFVTKGGALYVTAQSSVSWSGETSFSGNAGRNGGALLVEEECPLCIEEQSKVSWSGNTSFSGNSAEVGGALFVFRGNMLWSAETTFSGNTAKLHAGALHLRDSTLFWSGKTNFSENSAGTEAGAVTASSSYSSSDQVCNLSWSGETSFVGNTAGTDGGALHVELESYVSWSGETIFSGNTAYRSGGAIALIENSLSPGTVAFVGNTAGVSGGALYMSTVVVGPKFVMANFTSNTASQGGVVYSASSGTSVESGIPYPTTYERCNIFENRASSSGGAIESVAGIDWIVNTTFTGNLAGVGGALRLGGNTELDGCTFIDNVSDENEGAAISNVGTLELDGNRTRFSGNVFWCEVGTFVDMINATTANVTRFEKVCHGCGECDACGMEDENSVPICTAAIKNTRSEGGDTSIETLKLDRGFWRATNSSRIVLACYKEEACVGGISGTSSFCLPGYEGPCENFYLIT